MKNATVKYLFLVLVCCLMTACLPGKKREEKVIADAAKATQSVMTEKVAADLSNAANSLLGNSESTGESNSELATLRCADGRVLAYIPRTAKVAKQGTLPEGIASRMREQLQSQYSPQNVKTAEALSGCGGDPQLVAMNGPVLVLDSVSAALAEVKKDEAVASFEISDCGTVTDADGKTHKIPGVIIRYNDDRDDVNKCGSASLGGDSKVELANNAMPDWRKRLTGGPADSVTNFKCVVKKGRTNGCKPIEDHELGDKVDCNEAAERRDVVLNPVFNDATNTFISGPGNRDCGKGWSGDLIAQVDTKVCTITRKDGTVESEPSTVYDIAYVAARCSKDNVINIPSQCPAGPGTFFARYSKVDMVDPIQLEPQKSTARTKNSGTKSLIATSATSDLAPGVSQSILSKIGGGKIFKPTTNLRAISDPDQFSASLIADMGESAKLYQISGCNTVGNTCGSSPDHIVIVLDRSISMGSKEAADQIAVKPALNKTYSCKAGLRNIFQADKASDSCQKVNSFLANQAANPAANDKKLLDFILTPWAGLSGPNSSNTELYSALENNLVNKEKYTPYLQQALAAGWNCSGQKQANETIKPFPTNMFGSCSGASSCDTCPGECVAENIGVSPGLETTRIKAAKLNLVNISKMKMKPGTNITVAEFLNDVPNIRTTTYCPADRRNSAGACDEVQERKNVLNYLTGGEKKVYLKPVTQEITIPKESPGVSTPPTTPTPTESAGDVRSTRTRYVYIIPDQRFETSSHKESSGYFEAPANMAITGRFHNGDENGQTAYKYASLKAVYEDGTPAPGTVTMTDYAWSNWFKESSINTSPYDASRVMVGRQHSGDENGNTRHKLATIRYNGEALSNTMVYQPSVGNFKFGQSIAKESAWHWAEAGGWEFMYRRNHGGDETKGTSYAYGTPQKQVTLTSDACPPEQVTGIGEWKTAAQAQADGTFNASGTGAYADYEPRQNTANYSFRNCTSCNGFNCPGSDGWLMSGYTQHNGGGDILDPYNDPFNEGGPKLPNELTPDGEVYITEYCAERMAKNETFKFGSKTCGGTTPPPTTGGSCNALPSDPSNPGTTQSTDWETVDQAKASGSYGWDVSNANVEYKKAMPNIECLYAYGDPVDPNCEAGRANLSANNWPRDSGSVWVFRRVTGAAGGNSFFPLVPADDSTPTETCTTTTPAPVCTTTPGTCDAGGGPGPWETYAQTVMAGTAGDSSIPNLNWANGDANAENVTDYEFRNCTRHASCGYDEGTCAYEGPGSPSCGGLANCQANNPAFPPSNGWITDFILQNGAPQFGYNFDYNFCTERRKKVTAGTCTTTNIPAGPWETWQEARAAGKSAGQGVYHGEPGAEYEYDQCREANCLYNEDACYAGHQSECAQAASCYSNLMGGINVTSDNHGYTILENGAFDNTESLGVQPYPQTWKFCDRRRTKARTVTGSPTPVTTCTTPSPVTTCTPVTPTTPTEPQSCATNICDPSACALLIDGEEDVTPPSGGGSCEPTPVTCEIDALFEDEQSFPEWPIEVNTSKCPLDMNMDTSQAGGPLSFNGRSSATMQYDWGSVQGNLAGVSHCSSSLCNGMQNQNGSTNDGNGGKIKSYSYYKYIMTGTKPADPNCNAGGNTTGGPGPWERFDDASVISNPNYDQNTGEPAPGTVGMYDYNECDYTRADSFSYPKPFQDKMNGVTTGPGGHEYGDFCNLRRLKVGNTTSGNTTGQTCTTTQPEPVCTTTDGGTSGGTPAGPWETVQTAGPADPSKEYEYDQCDQVTNCDQVQSFCDYSYSDAACGSGSALARCNERYDEEIYNKFGGNVSNFFLTNVEGGGCGWSSCTDATYTYCKLRRVKATSGTPNPPVTTCTTPPPVTTCTAGKSYEKLLACLDKCSPKGSALVDVETCTSVPDLFKGSQPATCKTAPFPSKLDYSYNGYTGPVAKATITRYVLGKAGDPGAIAVDQNTANAVYGADYGGNTPLFDVIAQALNSGQVKADMDAHKNMAFIVLTDGADTGTNPLIKGLCDDSDSMMSVVRAKNTNTSTLVVSYNDVNTVLNVCESKYPDKFVQHSKLENVTTVVSALSSSGDYGTTKATAEFCNMYFGTGLDETTAAYTNFNVSAVGGGVGGNMCRSFETE